MLQLLHIGDRDVDGRTRRDVAKSCREDVRGFRKFLKQCRTLATLFCLFICLASFSLLFDQAVDGALPDLADKVHDTDAIEQREGISVGLQSARGERFKIHVGVQQRAPDLVNRLRR